jgi:NAD(P)-dependent dehydrogenase (short-subunit alcohol dehydrogenase family)
MSTLATRNGDPRTQGPQPPFPKQQQTPPGSEAAMQPQPDFGEATYRGPNRLKGKTALIPSTMPPDQTVNFGKQSLTGRPAQPAELAPLFVFLDTDESNYITGEVVGVTGSKSLS